MIDRRNVFCLEDSLVKLRHVKPLRIIINYFDLTKEMLLNIASYFYFGKIFNSIMHLINY